MRITKSSTAAGGGRVKLAQKSASLLRGNAHNKLQSMKSHVRHDGRAGSPKKAAQALSSNGFSVERMIRELGDHFSELNLQLLHKVNAQASYQSGLLPKPDQQQQLP